MKSEKTENIVETKPENKSGIANAFVIVIALIFIAMSACMIFLENISVEYLCYGVCTAVIIAAVYMIVRYFITDAYKNMNAYGFSIGTFLLILALCGFLKAEAMAGALITILGIVLLLSGIIVLQHSLDLHRMKDVIWIPAIIIAIIILICSIIVILQPMTDKFNYDAYVWWMILVASSFSFIINIYTAIRLKLYIRKENKAGKEDNKPATEESGTGVEENGDVSVIDNNSESQSTEIETENSKPEEIVSEEESDKESVSDN